MVSHNLDKEFRLGVIFALLAFGLWALIQPYFFGVFKETGALVVMAHRTLWSCLFIWIWLALRGKVFEAFQLVTHPRTLGILTLTGLLIAFNWATYIYAVQSQRLLDASVGYFMTPLMTAAFGIIFLREHPRPLQIWALIFSALGVITYTLFVGQIPFIALILSVTFSAYGGIRKLMGIPAEQGMAVETSLISPIALCLIVTVGWQGPLYGIATNLQEASLLIAAGLVTLLPLVLYNAAAARLPLISLGLLQFIVPIGLFVLSLLPPLKETLDPAKASMFILIWIGLVFYVWDLLTSSSSRSGDT